MLETLRVKNFALIDEVEIELKSGLSALTGETGAGKSILVGALNLVLGARASAETVRQGAKKAHIEAIFDVGNPSKALRALLDEHDVELEDGRLLLARTISAEGRSRAYAGGALVPVGVLAQLGDELVDLHGQHDHQSLLRTDRQLDLLDAFAGCEALRIEVADLVGKLRQTQAAIDELATEDRERERRLEFLRFEAGEIDEAGFVPGEEEELRSRQRRIANAESLVSLSGEAYAALYENEEGAAVDRIDAALKALENLADIDPELRALVDRAERARTELEDLAAEVRRFSEIEEFDPEELEEVNQRLALLSNLKRKYGDSVEAILAYRDKAAAEIEQYAQRDERLAALRKECEALQVRAVEKAESLSKKRKAAGRKLEKETTTALQDLGMKGGVFEVHFDRQDLALSGLDKASFLLAANPGEAPKALKQVASGGEMSRIMLALKTVSAHADAIPTLIFDEIDAGVGGAVANHVAARLQELGASHQVLCITHLPQIAAAAGQHLRVEKRTAKGRTATAVERLEADARIEEVARMLDGSVSDVSLEHARQLLAAEAKDS